MQTRVVSGPRPGRGRDGGDERLFSMKEKVIGFQQLIWPRSAARLSLHLVFTYPSAFVLYIVNDRPISRIVLSYIMTSSLSPSKAFPDAYLAKPRGK